MDFTLKGSNYGSSWTSLGSWTGQTWHDLFVEKTFGFSNSDGYRYYRLEVTKNRGDLGMTQLSEIMLIGPEGSVSLPDVANSDIPVLGTVTGNYTDTQSSDDVYQEITETQSGGKPSKRHSYLEHTWTINVMGGDTVTFYVEAYKTNTGDGDNFVFAYSTDDANYTDMLTVTKTSDDNAYQTFNLPWDLSGTVYIRVKDTDQTPGNRSLDTVFIDHMFIRSDSGTSLPPAPTGLTASPGNSQVSLTWNASAGAESYNVRGSTTIGGPYTTIATSVTANSYTDTGLNNGTTYYYVVSAVNAQGESIDSNEASATPQVLTDMHVQSITVTTVTVGKGEKKGHAQVVIADNNGQPVPGANVTGTFTGDINESGTETTDAGGQAVIETTGKAKGGVAIMFCVNDVVGPLFYESNANVETCDTN
jgi:hypothetical protein